MKRPQRRWAGARAPRSTRAHALSRGARRDCSAPVAPPRPCVCGGCGNRGRRPAAAARHAGGRARRRAPRRRAGRRAGALEGGFPARAGGRVDGPRRRLLPEGARRARGPGRQAGPAAHSAAFRSQTTPRALRSGRAPPPSEGASCTHIACAPVRGRVRMRGAAGRKPPQTTSAASSGRSQNQWSFFLLYGRAGGPARREPPPGPLTRC